MSSISARVAVLIPAYNEAHQIASVLETMPDFVDHVVVVDDASTDGTSEVVARCAETDPRVHLITLERNQGVGGALRHAYRWAADADVDVAVTIDGDGQMDPAEMADMIQPILDGRADYTKGNRLADPRAWQQIPRVRLLGNSVLSLLTKIVSGYWAVMDSQSGYSAAGRYALQHVEWERMYPRYGRPNDVLVLANMAECRVLDVPIRPIYGVGERSTMKILTVVFAISALLFRRFWWRLTHKYVLRDFHPLVFFYLLAILAFVASTVLGIRLVWIWAATGSIPPINALALFFMAITTLNSTFFAFWMDKEANADLMVRTRPFRHPAIRDRRDRPDGVADDEPRAHRAGGEGVVHPSGETAAGSALTDAAPAAERATP